MRNRYCEICNCNADYTYIDNDLEDHHICFWCDEQYELCIVCGTFEKKKNMKKDNICSFCEAHSSN
ncbi:hypothetical protein ACV3Z5_14155 [Clostridium perfringens]